MSSRDLKQIARWIEKNQNTIKERILSLPDA
jgi:hypothetical protein